MVVIFVMIKLEKSAGLSLIKTMVAFWFPPEKMKNS